MGVGGISLGRSLIVPQSALQKDFVLQPPALSLGTPSVSNVEFELDDQYQVACGRSQSLKSWPDFSPTSFPGREPQVC